MFPNPGPDTIIVHPNLYKYLKENGCIKDGRVDMRAVRELYERLNKETGDEI